MSPRTLLIFLFIEATTDRQGFGENVLNCLLSERERESNRASELVKALR